MKNNFKYTENGIEVDISEAVHGDEEAKESQSQEVKTPEGYAQLLNDIANKKDSE
jgi:hypothetical protein